jgi:predicted kinase
MSPPQGVEAAAQPRLLLLTGAPASGKSLLAARLVARFEACRCSKDEIKELLFDTLGQGDAAWSRRLSNASFALLFAYAPRLLRAGRLLLLEGNFRPGEHEAPCAAVLCGGGAILAQVLCQADAATRRARLSARALDPGRHPGHRAQPLPETSLEAGLLELPGPRWRYDSASGADGEWHSLCGRIERWLADAASRD